MVVMGERNLVDYRKCIISIYNFANVAYFLFSAVDIICEQSTVNYFLAVSIIDKEQ